MNNMEKQRMAQTSKTVGIILLLVGIASSAGAYFLFTGNGFWRFAVVVPLTLLYFSRECFKYWRKLIKELETGKNDEDITTV